MISANSDEGAFLKTQGATYFSVALMPAGTALGVTSYATIQPVSGSSNRVTGHGLMFTQDETEPMGVGGMSVTIWDWYSEELIGVGITHPDGSYDIGVDVSDSTLAWMDVGEAFEITDRYLGVFADGGYSGNGGTWKQILLGLSLIHI